MTGTPDADRLETLKAWQETWKDKGYPYPVPTASFLAGFDAAAARVRAAQAQAWEEGFHEGRANVSHNKPCDGRLWYDDDGLDDNPYRSEPVDEFQNPED